GGSDAAKFTIDASTGALSFLSAPDFETPTYIGGDNLYTVSDRASSAYLSDTQAIAVTVTNVNDNPPVITSNGGGAAAAVNVAEKIGRASWREGAEADVGSTLSNSKSGGAGAGKFTIDALTGALSLLSARGDEPPT